ncbi:hypothetical protein LOS22_14605 [Enterococcus faecium]|nr:hypothetical protein [Enterococcus faecium]
MQEKYNIFVPIDVAGSVEKSEQANDGEWYVQGYATTPDLDLQGDIILPQELTFLTLLLKGG